MNARSLCTAIAMSFAVGLYSLTAHAGEFRTLYGNPADARPAKLFGPVLDLEGGGVYVRDALQATIDKVRGCTGCDTKLDVVLLQWVPPDTKDVSPDTLKFEAQARRLEGVDSIETIAVSTGNLSLGAAHAVETAEIVFFDGGAQCNYVTNFRGSLLEAVKKVYDRGGGIAGMSAGQAILGEYIYDGCAAGPTLLTSGVALADPFSDKISFSYDFLPMRYMANTLMDQHVVTRNRFGRTLVFLARQLRDGKAKVAYGIAVDESISVVVDRDGLATVIGKNPVEMVGSDGKKFMAHAWGENPAYFITADHMPEVCEKGKPLTYSNFKVWKVRPGQTYNLKNRPKDGYQLVSVKDGKLDRDPY